MNTRTFTAILFLSIVTLCTCGVNNAGQSPVDKLDKIYPTLFLLSAGLKTDTLKSAFLIFLEKDPTMYSVAIIVNASTTEKKKNKKTKKIKIQFSEMGFDSTKIEKFDLMKRSPAELSTFDIIYTLGGNPFLLLDEVNKSGFRTILKELAYQDKIMMGYSAGSLLLGPDLTLLNHADSLLGFNEMGLNELSCLGLYDFYIFPHYADFTRQVPELIANINQFERQSKFPIYRLKDNQGIIYRYGKIEVIGN